MKKTFITTTLIFCMALAFSSKRPEKPNILIIYADDLGWQDVGCYDVDNNAIFETPYMDALSKEGVKFWQAYSPACVCGPSRASILTGKHPARLGITSVAGGTCPKPLSPHFKVMSPYKNIRLEASETTIAEALKPYGYLSGHSGKWHIVARSGFPQPKDQGFDFSRQNRGIHQSKGWNVKERIRDFATTDPNDPYRLDENGYAFDETTEDALDFMKEAVQKEKPFFCYFAAYLVHTPIHIRTEDLLKKYALKMGYGYPLKGDEIFEVGQRNPYYAAMVEKFDYNVHQLVSYLKQQEDPRWKGHQLIENTYVFITSDNGGMERDQENITDNYPLDRGKINLQEGGIRVPFLVLGPDIPKNVESQVMVNGMDIMPTILNLTGAKKQKGFDGCDLTKLLRKDPTNKKLVEDENGKVRNTMFWHFPHSVQLNTSIRKDRFKLIMNYDHIDNPHKKQFNLYELYDEKGNMKDINEQIDLAESKPALLAEMLSDLNEVIEDMGAMPAYRNPNCLTKLSKQELVPKVVEHGAKTNGEVWLRYETNKAKITEAALLYTLNGGSRREDWYRITADVSQNGKVIAKLPKGTTHYVFNIVDENNFLRSYPEVGTSQDNKIDSEYAIIAQKE